MASCHLRDRIGWDSHLRPFLFKKLPPNTGWSATLGSLSALLFLVMAVTGMFLAMYYNPSPDKAYQSIDYIMNDVTLGRILRGLHHWGAGAMVLVVAVHLLTNFFTGTYKAPRELTWIVGVMLFILTLALGFTGYLLPWDMKAYWATVVSSNIPKDIPVVGQFLTRFVLGGDGMSGLTLTRFYSIHMLVLPALLVVFVAMHIYLVRIHGMAEHKAPAKGEDAKPACACADSEKLYRFHPEHTLRSALVFVCVFIVLLALAAWGTVPREEIAGTLLDSYLPRPEWYYMWLFQLLTYFSGAWETVGSLAIPVVGVGLLFATPYIGRSTLLGAANRPLPVAIGVTAIICVVYLSLMGFESARPYGQIVIVPDRELSAVEQRGLYLYADRECAYCHQIKGRGGHRTGPDMANMAAKKRSIDYMERYIKDPQKVSSTSVMPKYDLPDADRKALATFTLCLRDIDAKGAKRLDGKEVLKTFAPAAPQAPALP